MTSWNLRKWIFLDLHQILLESGLRVGLVILVLIFFNVPIVVLANCMWLLAAVFERTIAFHIFIESLIIIIRMFD